jgi:hypothetical protein
MTTASRRSAIAVGVACAAVLLAACGGSNQPGATATTTVTATASASPSAPATTPAGGGTTTPTTPAGGPSCATSALHATIGLGNGAAGSTYLPITFTNTSGTSCTLYGYPGVSFVSDPSGGPQIGAAATRNPQTPSQVVTLAAGATAHATLQLVTAQNFPPSKCKITTAHWLRVYPPGETAPIYLKFKAQVCGGGPHAHGVLSIQAVQSGSSGT